MEPNSSTFPEPGQARLPAISRLVSPRFPDQADTSASTLALSSRGGAPGARRPARPADVEPRLHRPTLTPTSLARRRAHPRPHPRDVTQGGGTAVAPPRAFSDWPPRCHHLAGSWQGMCVCVCVCVWGLLCHLSPPSRTDAAGLAQRPRSRRTGPRRCLWRLLAGEDATSSLHNDATGRSTCQRRTSACPEPRPRCC